MQTQAIHDAIARYQGLAALTDRELIADAIGRMDGLARADATLMPLFARQLEHIYSEIEKIEYPELAAANGDILPVDSSIPEGASTWTYRQYDAVGFAKFWNPMADDIPMATFTGQEFSGPLRYIVEGFAYNLFDLKALRFAGVEGQLDSLRAEMVRRHHDQTINRTWLFGEEDIGLLGFLTHPNITITDVPAGASTFTPWANKTAAEIIADVGDAIDAVDEISLGVEKVDAFYLPRAQLNLIKRLPVGDAFPNTTVFQFLFGPGGVYADVKVRAVNELAAANSFGQLDADVAIATTTNVRKAAFVSQEDFKMLPPIELGLKFEIHTYSGIGGCRLRRPLAVHLIRGI